MVNNMLGPLVGESPCAFQTSRQEGKNRGKEAKLLGARAGAGGLLSRAQAWQDLRTERRGPRDPRARTGTVAGGSPSACA